MAPTKKGTTPPAPAASGLGLEAVGDLSSFLKAAPAAPNGKPLDIPLAQIEEDPNQPRRTFDEDTLRELADSIGKRGVKTPISVKPHPEQADRYILNHGARRFRASLLANATTIPAYIDTDYDSDDQVIENLHRDGLTPREIADYIGRQLSAGRTKGEIAAGLYKSPAYISQHATLLDLPDPIAEAFNQGRCGDVTVINELVRAYKKDAAAVTAWLEVEDQEINRHSVKVLRDFIEAKKKAADKATAGQGAAATPGRTGQWSPSDIKGGPEGDGDDPAPAAPEPEQIPMFGGDEDEPPAPLAAPPAPTVVPPAAPRATGADQDHDPEKFKKAIVFVTYDGRPARLVLTRRPSAAGLGWIKMDADGSEEEVALDLLTISHLVEG
jgi:ParB family transcriptional regulator, chromosome partitioning protein